MIILPNRTTFIKDHFFEFSFNEDGSDEEVEPDFEAFQTLNSAEQYYLADLYNWDDGVQVLDWIVDSPRCDKGTAVMIFWKAEPDFYFDYTEETIGEWEKDVWMLLQKILKKIRSGAFARSRFAFNPAKRGYKTDWPSATGIWALPDDLKKGTRGIRPMGIE